MSLNRYAKRRDKNELEIVKAFINMGFSVERLDTPLDLLIGWNNRNYLVEVKMPGKKPNENQVEFMNNWKGQYFLCYTVEQAYIFGGQVKTSGRLK